MASKKNRKRRPREQTTAAVAVPASSAAQRRTEAVPSPTARITGAAIGAVTVALAAFMFMDAFANDRAAVDAIARVVAGVFLIAIGVAVGVLSLFPGQVRRMIRGR